MNLATELKVWNYKSQLKNILAKQIDNLNRLEHILMQESEPKEGLDLKINNEICLLRNECIELIEKIKTVSVNLQNIKEKVEDVRQN